MGSIIRSTGTVFYSLSCLNSWQAFYGLKYVYSVISVIVYSLPGNTKNRESTRSWTARVRLVHPWAVVPGKDAAQRAINVRFCTTHFRTRVWTPGNIFKVPTYSILALQVRWDALVFSPNFFCSNPKKTWSRRTEFKPVTAMSPDCSICMGWSGLRPRSWGCSATSLSLRPTKALSETFSPSQLRAVCVAFF